MVQWNRTNWKFYWAVIWKLKKIIHSNRSPSNLLPHFLKSIQSVCVRVCEALGECSIVAVDVFRWSVSHLLISTIVRIAIKSSTHAEWYMCETVSFQIIKQIIQTNICRTSTRSLFSCTHFCRKCIFTLYRAAFLSCYVNYSDYFMCVE